MRACRTHGCSNQRYLLREAESSWLRIFVSSTHDSQPAPNMLLSPRRPRPAKVGLATPPAPTLSRYIASVPARRPPIVTLFDQVGAVVNVGSGCGINFGRYVLQALPNCSSCANATRDHWSEEWARSLRTMPHTIIRRRLERVKAGSLNRY
jgi:hypothetical protein